MRLLEINIEFTWFFIYMCFRHMVEVIQYHICVCVRVFVHMFLYIWWR